MTDLPDPNTAALTFTQAEAHQLRYLLSAMPWSGMLCPRLPDHDIRASDVNAWLVAFRDRLREAAHNAEVEHDQLVALRNDLGAVRRVLARAVVEEDAS